MGPYDRELLRLAVPALGALVAEPLFLIADSAIVGHLGTAQLAGLGVASTVLLNAVLLCVFLSYGTTAAVARRLGSGDLRGALAQGIDGIWLAIGVGVALAVLGVLFAPLLVGLFDPSPSATPHAVTYLRISLLGLPAMLVLLAATGVLRGLQNTRTPLAVSVLAAVVNVVLNLLLVHVAGWGIAGSAVGTVLSQLGAATWLVSNVVRGARRQRVRLLPHGAGILATGTASAALLLRTVLLRIALIIATYVATAQGDVALAAHQIAYTLWFLLAMPPESFAIAGQAMVGYALGASDPVAARRIARRALAWGLASGLTLAVLLAVLRPLYVPVFTSDQDVQSLVSTLVLVLAVTQPVGAVLYVLDGILVGAGDTRYLAVSMLAALLLFLPLAGLVLVRGAGVVALWWTVGAFLLARQLALVLRIRSRAWLVTGATR